MAGSACKSATVFLQAAAFTLHGHGLFHATQAADLHMCTLDTRHKHLPTVGELHCVTYRVCRCVRRERVRGRLVKLLPDNFLPRRRDTKAQNFLERHSKEKYTISQGGWEGRMRGWREQPAPNRFSLEGMWARCVVM